MATDVKMDWTNPATIETGSNVYRNQTGSAPWGVPIVVLPADSITYTDPQVADGTWWYRVTNIVVGGESVDDGSNINSITLPAAGFIVQDTFTDTNGVLLENHTPDVDTVGGGWEVPDHPWTVQSNAARGNDGNLAVESPILIQIGVADQKVTGTYAAQNAQGMGAVLRAVDKDNYWQCEVDDTFVIIRDVVAGTPTFRVLENIAITYPISWTATAIADVISIDVGQGQTVASYTSTLYQAATGSGMYAVSVGGVSSALMDSISMEAG